MTVGFDLLAHIQDGGDVHAGPGVYAGTRGENRRLEGFTITLDPWTRDLGVRYRADVRGVGDTGWINGGSFVGTRGQSRTIEGFRIELTGECLSEYDVLYMAHVSGSGEDHGNDKGDTVWLANGEYCGGHGRQIEGLAVQIVARKPNFVRLVSKATSGNRSPLQITASSSPRSTSLSVSAPDGSDYQVWDRRPMRGATGYALISRGRPNMCISRGEGDVAVLRHVADLATNDRSIWLDDTVPGGWNAIRSMTDLERKLNMRGAPPYADNNNALIVHPWMRAANNELWEQKKAAYDMIFGADAIAFNSLLRAICEMPPFRGRVFQGERTFPSSDIHTVRFNLATPPEVSVSSSGVRVAVRAMELWIEGSVGSWWVTASMECRAEAFFVVYFYDSETNKIKLSLLGGQIRLQQHQEAETRLNELFMPALIEHLGQELFRHFSVPMIGMIYNNRYQAAGEYADSGHMTRLYGGALDAAIEPRPLSWPSGKVFAAICTERLISVLERELMFARVLGRWYYGEPRRGLRVEAYYQVSYRHPQFILSPESGNQCKVRFGLQGWGYLTFHQGFVPNVAGTGHVSFTGRFAVKDQKQIVLICESTDDMELEWHTNEPSLVEDVYPGLFRALHEMTRNEVLKDLRVMEIPICTTAAFSANLYFLAYPAEVTVRDLEVNSMIDAENRQMIVVSGVPVLEVKRPQVANLEAHD